MTETVLIADDDVGLAEVLALRCEALGLNTVVVDNAHCAQMAMISEQPTLSILDLNMPAADDGTILDVLRKDPELAELRVVIMTGEKNERIVQECESLQVQYLPKQRNVWARLRDVVQELLDDRPDPFPATLPFPRQMVTA